MCHRHEVTAALDIAVSSSIIEGFSNAIGEAMSCAVPCVVTDVGESEEIVEATGKVVPKSNPVALANAIQMLLDMPEADRMTLGAMARSRVEKMYSLPAIVEKYDALFAAVSRER